MTSRCPQNLGELLLPLTPEKFFEDVWGQGPRHLRGHPDRFADLLDLDGVVAVLKQLSARLPDVMIMRNGVDEPSRCLRLAQALEERSPSAAELLELCGDATLIINRSQHKHAAVGELSRMLFAQLGEWVSANIYLSPGGGTVGLGYHYDCWEVFVLQLEGTKSWELYPTRADRPVDKVDFDAPRLATEQPTLQMQMTPGDVLYMPRGTWHRAQPDAGRSLHLTVGVHCKMPLDLTGWLWRELSCDPRGSDNRADLPLSRVGHEAEAAQRESIEAGLARIRGIVESPDAVSRYLAHRFDFETMQMWPKAGVHVAPDPVGPVPGGDPDQQE